MEDMGYDEILKDNTRIESKNIILRPFSIEDREDVLEYGKDEKVTKYLTWNSFYTIEDAENTIEKYYKNKLNAYAIELRCLKKCIGCIEIRVDAKNNKATFGYLLNSKYWGRGIMTEALMAVLDLAFNKLNLNRVEGCHYVGNEGSGKVMKKCMMKYEGTALEEVFIKERYYDVVHYGITRKQYKEIYG